MRDPIKADCRRDFYPAAHQSGRRKLSDVIWIVLHDTEGGTAAGIARYFQSPGAGGSAHLVVDDDACYRCLPNSAIPWGAPGANREGFHIEQCGFARWSAVVWRKHWRTLQRAAYKTALHCALFDIPPVFRTAPELRRRLPGVTTHVEVSRAFGLSTHTDPGPAWPRSLFMRLVRRYLAEIERTKGG